MSLAEQINRYRVVPRLAIAYYLSICYDTHKWYIDLDTPTAEQAAYTVLIWGAAAAWFKFYVDSGASLKELKENRE